MERLEESSRKHLQSGKVNSRNSSDRSWDASRRMLLHEPKKAAAAEW